MVYQGAGWGHFHHPRTIFCNEESTCLMQSRRVSTWNYKGLEQSALSSRQGLEAHTFMVST